MKRCSTSLVTKRMQIKNTMNYHLISIRMAIIKKPTQITCDGKDIEETGTLYTTSSNVNWYKPLFLNV